MSKLNVIYVDDEIIALKNFQYTVSKCLVFNKVTLFHNPTEALGYAEKNQIDIAYLDIDMPVMNGFLLCKKLKILQPNIIIAFVTGEISYMDYKNRTIQASYIFKPYMLDDILEVLPT